MTTQERAAELCFKLALLVDAGTHMEVDTDAMKAIADALTATRRAAMLEVAELHQEWRNGKHSGTFSDLLRHKLAQEG